jgi:cellulose biosynthesis protein BcsQ
MTFITGIANFKGGVTKTTLPINFVTILKRRKGRIIMIDTDPQGNIITPNNNMFAKIGGL